MPITVDSAERGQPRSTTPPLQNVEQQELNRLKHPERFLVIYRYLGIWQRMEMDCLMSKYCAFIGDTPHDYRFKKHPHGRGWYQFFLGDTRMAALVNNSVTGAGKGWSVIVNGELDKATPRLVEGFISRHAAVVYLLEVHELTKSRYSRSNKRGE